MASTIKIKNSSTAGAVPGTGDLVQGELAINVTDRRIFTENASGTVVELGTPSIDDNGNATAITIDSSENVGIGTSSPNAKVDVAGSINVTSDNGLNGTWTGLATRYVSGNNSAYLQSVSMSSGTVTGGKDLTFDASQLVFRTISGASFTERARIDSSGNLLVGTTSTVDTGTSFKSSTPAAFYRTATAGGVLSWWSNNTSTQSLRGYMDSNGGIYNYSANNVNLSDRREKTNFAPAGEYLTKICSIPVQTFEYIGQEGEGLTLGVVAQDVQEAAPELVTEANWGTEDEPKMRLSIYQTDLQYALMKCIQEQQAMITSQSELITTLTERITALESQ